MSVGYEIKINNNGCHNKIQRVRVVGENPKSVCLPFFTQNPGVFGVVNKPRVSLLA